MSLKNIGFSKEHRRTGRTVFCSMMICKSTRLRIAYLYTELHCDLGPPYGTTNPLEAICECPIERLDEYFSTGPARKFENNDDLFEWIEEQGRSPTLDHA